jgi:hypothetical protein
MRPTEADTCRKYVLPKLYAANWTDDQISEQKTFSNGRIVVAKVLEDKVLPGVLDSYFRMPSVWPNLSGVSTGTNVRRRRLNPEHFLNYRMPLPSRPTQEKLRVVRGHVDALKHLQAETAAELDALLPFILDKAFKGDL